VALTPGAGEPPETFTSAPVPDDRRDRRSDVAAAYFWYTGDATRTDDAYVRAAEVSVSTDVSGIVTEVDVKESEPVKAGDVLFRIDPRQYQNALDNRRPLSQRRAEYRRPEDQLSGGTANHRGPAGCGCHDQLTVNRFSDLVKGNLAITQAQYDQHV